MKVGDCIEFIDDGDLGLILDITDSLVTLRWLKTNDGIGKLTIQHILNNRQLYRLVNCTEKELLALLIKYAI